MCQMSIPCEAQRFSETSILVAGNAQVGKNSNLYTMYRVVSVQMVVDTLDDKILAIHSSLLSPLSSIFLNQVVAGKRAQDEREVENILTELNQRVFIVTKGPLLQAVRSALEKYLEVRASGGQSEYPKPEADG